MSGGIPDENKRIPTEPKGYSGNCHENQSKCKVGEQLLEFFTSGEVYFITYTYIQNYLLPVHRRLGTPERRN
jgi:hypothetical protein